MQVKRIETRVFIFDATVESRSGTLTGPVIFHLHDSYPQNTIWIRKIRDGRRAVLEDVSSYSMYTIGVQVKNERGEWVGLEYNLTQLTDLPQRFFDE